MHRWAWLLMGVTLNGGFILVIVLAESIEND